MKQEIRKSISRFFRNRQGGPPKGVVIHDDFDDPLQEFEESLNRTFIKKKHDPESSE